MSGAEDEYGATAWHRGSRYWQYGLPVVLIMQGLAAAALVWRVEVAGEAIGAAATVAAVFLGGAGATNVVERTAVRRAPPREPAARTDEWDNMGGGGRP